MRRVGPGHYEALVGTWVCNVSNTGPVPGRARGYWYWLVSRDGEQTTDGGADWYASKAEALEALQAWLAEKL